jgi:hypothetical protein
MDNSRFAKAFYLQIIGVVTDQISLVQCMASYRNLGFSLQRGNILFAVSSSFVVFSWRHFEAFLLKIKV